jgi:hypothetical protein
MHCRNQDFWVEGQKNLFVTNEFNCIKIDKKAIFLLQWQKIAWVHNCQQYIASQAIAIVKSILSPKFITK